MPDWVKQADFVTTDLAAVQPLKLFQAKPAEREAVGEWAIKRTKPGKGRKAENANPYWAERSNGPRRAPSSSAIPPPRQLSFVSFFFARKEVTPAGQAFRLGPSAEDQTSLQFFSSERRGEYLPDFKK